MQTSRIHHKTIIKHTPPGISNKLPNNWGTSGYHINRTNTRATMDGKKEGSTSNEKGSNGQTMFANATEPHETHPLTTKAKNSSSYSGSSVPTNGNTAQ